MSEKSKNEYVRSMSCNVRDFLQIKWNEKQAVQLEAYELNPFLKILETMGRECLIEMKSYSDLKKDDNAKGVYYLVYPKVYDINKGNPEEVLGIGYIKNPYKKNI